MKSTVRADMLVVCQLAMKNHLGAAGAFLPHVLTHIALGQDAADFGADKVSKPVHNSLFLLCLVLSDLNEPAFIGQTKAKRNP